jgi:hypothetical protein
VRILVVVYDSTKIILSESSFTNGRNTSQMFTSSKRLLRFSSFPSTHVSPFDRLTAHMPFPPTFNQSLQETLRVRDVSLECLEANLFVMYLHLCDSHHADSMPNPSKQSFQDHCSLFVNLQHPFLSKNVTSKWNKACIIALEFCSAQMG